MTDDQNGVPGALVVPLDDYDARELYGDHPDPNRVASLGLTWRAKDHHYGVREEGRTVAHTGLVVLPLTVGGVRTEVVGVGGVGVRPERRGRGLARLVVTGALAGAGELGPELAMLFCRPDVSGLYRGMGWQDVEAEVEVDQPGGPLVMPLRTMWFALRPGARWPAGPVRLHSLPM